ncbi:histidine kinase [Leadbetterella byssophila DSM 17132]|uniref:histidine kinase n=1 Tax=Leadbetterella byssophila (strain DSM 17132 / JCM 16389 / KACC 11308 / NBRC 106382 / 4M15) TaxID=649349 RepID=E4RW45_LEAB4|nr:ATP-binding protein [Leadbetterella byssophila]ADQ16188.1 histidine kinase [Leadbetterella byssophila DSM 17132]
MDNATQILELKKKLSEEIQKESSDNNVILALSSEIAKLDDSQVRFSVDAGIINRLGKELVGKHETAVSELVKNAFDADATEVNLVFENAWNAGGTVTIEDNGTGMTKDQLINGFMRLSSSDKIHNPVSDKYKRTRAGRKGIGRFATQRLGSRLTIITHTAKSESSIKISINWNDFETDKDLLSVSNNIEVIPKSKVEGTTLIIENLRDGWSDAMIRRVFRYTSELLQPFPLSKKNKDEAESSIDPGFKSYYFRQEGQELIPIIDEEEAIFKHALAEIEGYVLDDGQGCWALKSDKLNFPQEVFLIGNDDKNRENTDAKFNLIKGLHFKTHYFIYEPSLFAPGTYTFIRDLSYETGGIRLYRNGFRVLPYGEQGDDWLGLDKSNNRQIILARHMNRSFFGFVELQDKEGLFEETSSREGLIENDALKELVDFVYRSIISAVIKVAELRDRKATASQKNFKRKEVDPTEKADNAVKELEEFFTEEETKENSSEKSGTGKSKEKAKQVFEEFKQAREEEKRKNQALIDENNMLRILAGLGLVIGEFIHEVHRFLPGFDAEISFLKNAVKDIKGVYERVELLGTNIKSFTSYTSYFDKAISRNVIRELQPIELRDVVKDFSIVIDNNLKRANIKLEKPIFDGYDLFTTPMHPSEWASILFNLYTNSKKAIVRKKVDGKILIHCGKDEKNVFLEFSDNGDGIPKENEDVIFNAFFTTTSAANHSGNDAESLVGTGLGLKIVKDIVEFYGGDVYVTNSPESYSTTIRIEIPKNQKEDE